MQTASWTTIRDAIAIEIANGHLQPGDKIPTETELAERYQTGRHSVRRAIADIAKQGMLSVEQGRGTFVEVQPVLAYTLGKRTRLQRSLGGPVYDVSRELLGAEIILAPGRVCEALRLDVDAKVSHARRMTSADHVPIAYGSAFHCVDRFPGFVERRAVFGSTTEAYKSYGINDYVRAETTLHSRPARADEAKMLRQHPDLSVTIIWAVDALPDGTPISFSEVVWSASRVRFTVEGDDYERA
ncbi:phosphonate metabolism transcriptional regulator PhnF [Rhodobacterales bacterium 52_120_T64]|nr:phosphonate metabolism transcriptional regulator PhnF [Rhodobacterales bacterium 52_120_T64]